MKFQRSPFRICMKEVEASQLASVAADREARKALLIDDLYHFFSYTVRNAIRIRCSLGGLELPCHSVCGSECAPQPTRSCLRCLEQLVYRRRNVLLPPPPLTSHFHRHYTLVHSKARRVFVSLATAGSHCGGCYPPSLLRACNHLATASCCRLGDATHVRLTYPLH